MRGRAFLPLAALSMLAGCLDGAPRRDEVAFAPSPDGAIHAILLETNGGATASFGYEIELHAASASEDETIPAGKLYEAARSDCAYGVNLRWLSPPRLAIEFKDAHSVAVPAHVQVGARTVTMIPRKGIEDEAAPCGGMLASLG